MANGIKIPYFSYEITNQSHKHNNGIMAEGEILHDIGDMNLFYEALGYTEEMRLNGIEPEVFRWSQYVKDNAVQSPVCLQSHIIEYLNKHSEKFREKYGRDYQRWAGSCAPENFRDSENCNNCRMHPKLK